MIDLAILNFISELIIILIFIDIDAKKKGIA